MHAQLPALAAYIRRNAMALRTVERVGPFVATFTQYTDDPFRNYAIPDDGAAPTAEDVADLGAAFERRSRMPRIEYFPALAPAVGPRLDAAGFVVEGRLALMCCRRADLRDVAAPDGITVAIAASGGEFLAAAVAQHEAYGEPEPAGQAEVTRLRDLTERGGLVAVAVEASTGIPAGGAVCDVIHDGLGEVAGVAVRQAFRRRGVATAISHQLAAKAFASGATTLFLTPAGPDEARVYQRVGFSEVDHQVHTSLPAQ
jgi:GNAT superfamily N-acetyltransferase